MSQTYAHTPLTSSRSIRLLRLKARISQPREEQFLQCELIEELLDNNPSYSAISYTWELQALTSFAVCNGKLLSITPNCESALRHILIKRAGHLLWVDSVCIDQTDVRERNHQVILMAEIYRKATNVLIWLGEGDEDSETAMRTLGRLSKLAILFPKLVDWKFRRMQKARHHKVLSNIGITSILWGCIPEIYLPGLHVMRSITSRSWFTRIWTLQEIVLARKAVVLCGSRLVSWNRLLRVADVISQADASYGFTQYPGDEFQRLRHVSTLRSLLGVGPPSRNVTYRLPSDHPFTSIKMSLPNEDATAFGVASHYFLASKLLCSDPKDKVYGLYAVLQQYGVPLPLPDYEKLTCTIYQETAEAVIKHDSSLELLSYVSSPRTLRDLPSWVPDPSQYAFAWVPGWEYSNASGSSSARFLFDGEAGLSISGQQIDMISSRASDLPDITDVIIYPDLTNEQALLRSYRPVLRIFQEWTKFALMPGNCSTGAPLDAFCMVTLQEVALAFRASPNGWSKLRDIFHEWVQAILPPAAIQDPSKSGPSSNELEDYSILADEPGMDDQDLAADKQIYTQIVQRQASKTVHHMLVIRGEGNCLFSTASGRLGLATKDLKVGDQIVLVSGMRVPMIIRQEAGYYSLVGAAYVDGVMQGELWPDDSTRLQEFKIR